MKNVSHRAGFTLFEVLVATIIFALGILAVVQGRTNSMRNVIESEKIGIATQLAQAKMAEMELKYQAEIDKNPELDSAFSEESGNFEAPFAEFSWKVQLRESKIEFKTEDIKKMLMKYGVEEDEAELQVEGQKLFINNLNKALKKNFAELMVTIQWSQFGNKRSIPVVTHLIPTKPRLELSLE